MKTKLLITIATISLLATIWSASAQTLTNQPAPAPANFSDGLKIMANAITSGTNWTIIGGYGRSLKAKNNLAFADVAYDFTENVGVVVGYDMLWAKGVRQFNAVKGGVTLQTEIYPLKWTGVDFLSGIKGTPFVGALLATPKGGGNVGTIVTTGINFDVVDFSKFSFDLGFQYENRSGQGQFDGNYGLVHLGLSRRF